MKHYLISPSQVTIVVGDAGSGKKAQHEPRVNRGLSRC
ncbi:hypothetical protein FOWG_11312 [Fusarium oxysporum f. sp. lycopersici MN25]|uniref:Uncharacterized protein n=1 Tax=Fusarium oxysporum Fo47 TaxID=660027 RepID=W9JPA9_FUSOX|nr:hypothetical protein FOZG_13902 [Fusarium oxysporum Fo47]EWZ86270.1 hypothetical protein FOWG_11312 [Fusarium oxysporum f. sp. lycopersici MN25]